MTEHQHVTIDKETLRQILASRKERVADRIEAEWQRAAEEGITDAQPFLWLCGYLAGLDAAQKIARETT